MIKPGRVAFSRMEEVVFGEPAAAAVAGIAERLIVWQESMSSRRVSGVTPRL